MPIITKTQGTLEYLVAENISAPHCFTTRLGGVSQGYLASMNIGTSRGDSRENVLENYRILGRAIGFAPENLVLTHQTHTDIVRVVGAAHWGAGLFVPGLDECDALVTNEPGTGLTVFTADCTPILLHDPVTGAVGAAHAGWQGTAADIAGKTVAAMVENFGCKPENIRAAIGPNIKQCCFETDRDVPEAMIAALGDRAKPFILSAGQKYYVNLSAMNTLFLQRAGVTAIEVAPDCTACRPDRYWSHRKVGLDRGSQGAIIICKEGTL